MEWYIEYFIQHLTSIGCFHPIFGRGRHMGALDYI